MCKLMSKCLFLALLALLLAATGCSAPPTMERVRQDENLPNDVGVTYGYIFNNLPGVGIHINPAFEHLGKDKRSFGRIITEVHELGDSFVTISFNYGRKSKIDFSDVENAKPLRLDERGEVTDAVVLKSRDNGELISRYFLYLPRSTFSRDRAANIFVMYTEPLSAALPYDDWGPGLTPEQDNYIREFLDRSDEAFSVQLQPVSD